MILNNRIFNIFKKDDTFTIISVSPLYLSTLLKIALIFDKDHRFYPRYPLSTTPLKHPLVPQKVAGNN